MKRIYLCILLSILTLSQGEGKPLQPSLFIGGIYAAHVDKLTSNKEPLLQGYLKGLQIGGIIPIQNSDFSVIVRGTLDVNSHFFEKNHETLGNFHVVKKDYYSGGLGLGYNVTQPLTVYGMAGIRNREKIITKTFHMETDCLKIKEILTDEEHARYSDHSPAYWEKKKGTEIVKIKNRQIHPFVEIGFQYKFNNRLDLGVGLQHTFFRKENFHHEFLKKTNRHSTLLLTLSYHFF